MTYSAADRVAGGDTGPASEAQDENDGCGHGRQVTADRPQQGGADDGERYPNQ